jgi:hypothetical protein
MTCFPRLNSSLIVVSEQMEVHREDRFP